MYIKIYLFPYTQNERNFPDLRILDCRNIHHSSVFFLLYFPQNGPPSFRFNWGTGCSNSSAEIPFFKKLGHGDYHFINIFHLPAALPSIELAQWKRKSPGVTNCSIKEKEHSCVCHGTVHNSKEKKHVLYLWLTRTTKGEEAPRSTEKKKINLIFDGHIIFWWKKTHHVFHFQLNKSLFLPNTFDNLSMSTLLFKQHLCGIAKFRKDLFNMPLQQLAPGKVQLAYPASKWLEFVFIKWVSFSPLPSISFSFFSPLLPSSSEASSLSSFLSTWHTGAPIQSLPSTFPPEDTSTMSILSQVHLSGHICQLASWLQE